MLKRIIFIGLCVFLLGINGTTLAADTEVILDSSTSTSGFSVKDSGNQTIMRAGGDGNVGIGTATPGKKLEVIGTVKATSFEGDGSLMTGISDFSVRDFSRGLVIQNNTISPNNQIVIEANEIILQDINDKSVRVTNVSLTVDIALSGVNGLDTGSEAANTWYYIWVIYDSSTAAGLLSTSSTNPAMPIGYAYKSLLGAIRNNGSSNFINIIQNGNSVVSAQSQVLSNGLAHPYAAVDLSSAIPPTAQKIKGNFSVTSTVDSTRVGGYIASTIDGFGSLVIIHNINANSYWYAPFILDVLEPQTMYYQNPWNSGPSPIAIHIIGWEYGGISGGSGGGGSNLWTRSGSDVYYNNGKVGIGTTSPNGPLHVNSIASQTTLQITDSLTGTGAARGLRLTSDGASSDIDGRGTTGTDGQIRFRTANTVRMSITSSGNVGIGTTSPGAKLEIGGVPGTDGIKFPDGTTQTAAFQKSMTIRTNFIGSFTLPNSASVQHTASCNADEIATGGGCVDGGQKDFYFFRPRPGGYECGWYNTSGVSKTYAGAYVYVNCLK